MSTTYYRVDDPIENLKLRVVVREVRSVLQYIQSLYIEHWELHCTCFLYFYVFVCIDIESQIIQWRRRQVPAVLHGNNFILAAEIVQSSVSLEKSARSMYSVATRNSWTYIHLHREISDYIRNKGSRAGTAAQVVTMELDSLFTAVRIFNRSNILPVWNTSILCEDGRKWSKC